MKELNRREVLEKGYVILYDCSDSIESLKKAMEFVGTISSISRGRTYEGEKAVELCKKLLRWGHLSPFEFVRIPTEYSLLSPVKMGIKESWRNNPVNYLLTWHSWSKEEREIAITVHQNNIALFKLKAPIFVERQIIRHRSFSFMEKSGRHKLLETDFYLPEDNLERKIEEEYNALTSKFPLEKARAILPLGTYTEFYMMGDSFAFANFFLQRLNKEAQEETRKYALTMLKMIKEKKQMLYSFIILSIKKLRKSMRVICKIIEEVMEEVE